MTHLVVGFAGGTGSGKTTFARLLEEKLGSGEARLLGTDSYYKDLSHLSVEDRARVNFDDPESIDVDLIIEHVERLREGKSVDAPVYDFNKHLRVAHKVERFDPPPRVLILEGILLFVDPRLRNLIDVKVFVDAAPDVRLIRRMRRDVAERGRTAEQVCHQYLTSVKGMHDLYVEPTKNYADLVVNNDGVKVNGLVADLVAAHALGTLKRLDSKEVNEGGGSLQFQPASYITPAEGRPFAEALSPKAARTAPPLEELAAEHADKRVKSESNSA